MLFKVLSLPCLLEVWTVETVSIVLAARLVACLRLVLGKPALLLETEP